jgi:hypothetical protein
MGDPMNTAGGFYVPDWYEEGVACPMELPIGQVIRTEDYGDLICIDRGGSMVINEDGVFRFDILHDSSLGAIPRLTGAVHMELSESTMRRILDTHSNPFVEPVLNFVCPADSCDTKFYTYGQAVTNYQTGVVYTHMGTDFHTGPSGVGVVYAASSGFVTYSGYVNTEGNRCGGRVVIDHGFGYETRYCHLIRRDVEVMDSETGETTYVTAGQPIGVAGNSGFTLEGEHVHIELRKDGIQQNFELFMGVSGDYAPIPLNEFRGELHAVGMDLDELLDVAEKVEEEVEVADSLILDVDEFSTVDETQTVSFGDDKSAGEQLAEEENSEETAEDEATKELTEASQDAEKQDIDTLSPILATNVLETPLEAYMANPDDKLVG